MNDNAKLLAEVLRSYEFKQGKNRLRCLDRFCCLGVACELYRRETGKGEWVLSGGESGAWDFIVNDEAADIDLPNTVREWLGFRTPNGEFGAEAEASLAECNDSGHYSFGRIAGLIEKHPELFVAES